MGVTLQHRIDGVDELTAMRHALDEELTSAEIDPAVRADVVLVVCELVTNGFLHGDAPSVDALIGVTGADDGRTEIDIWVWHPFGDRVELPLTIPASPSPMPPPDAVGGRGLAVVDRLVTSRHVVLDTAGLVVTCRIDLAADGEAPAPA